MSSRRKGNNQYGGVIGKIKPAQSPEEIARAAAYGNNDSPSQAELNRIAKLKAKYEAAQAAAAANPVVDPKKYRKVWENWSGGRSGRSRKSRRTNRRKRTRRHR
jgi:hypothetical protein